MSLELELDSLYCGDSLEILKSFPSDSVDMCITSPPYWYTRDYGHADQIGLQNNAKDYIVRLMDVFAQVKRVLKITGNCYVNMGDTYNGIKKGNTNNRQKAGVNTSSFTKPKQDGYPDGCMLMIPESFAAAMIKYGWCLRSKVIWHKPNAMPGGSAYKRFTLDYEFLYHFVKNPKKYYFATQYDDITSNVGKSKGIKFGGNKAKGYNAYGYSGNEWKPKMIELSKDNRNNAIKCGWDGISDYVDWYFNKRIKMGIHDHSNDAYKGFHQKHNKEYRRLAYPYGKIKRSVWSISTRPYKGQHFSTYPVALIETPIKASCPPDGIVLDPFVGAGTTCLAARKLGRHYIGIDLVEKNIEQAKQRLG